MFTGRFLRSQNHPAQRQWRSSPRRYATVADILASDKLVSTKPVTDKPKFKITPQPVSNRPARRFETPPYYSNPHVPVFYTPNSQLPTGSAAWWMTMDEKYGPNFEASFLLPETRDHAARIRKTYEFDESLLYPFLGIASLPRDERDATWDFDNILFSGAKLRKRADNLLFLVELARLSSSESHYREIVLAIGSISLCSAMQLSLHTRLLLSSYFAQPAVQDPESLDENNAGNFLWKFGWIKGYMNACLETTNLLLRHIVEVLAPLPDSEPLSTTILPLLHNVLTPIIEVSHFRMLALIKQGAQLLAHVPGGKAIFVIRPEAQAKSAWTFNNRPPTDPIDFLRTYQRYNNTAIQAHFAMMSAHKTMKSIYREMKLNGGSHNIRLLGQAENLLRMAITIDGDSFSEKLKRMLQEHILYVSTAVEKARNEPQQDELTAVATVRHLVKMMDSATHQTQIRTPKDLTALLAESIGILGTEKIRMSHHNALAVPVLTYEDAIARLKGARRKSLAQGGGYKTIVRLLQVAQDRIKAREQAGATAQSAQPG